jgi:protein involved in polysaccharide export with SLBB domain
MPRFGNFQGTATGLLVAAAMSCASCTGPRVVTPLLLPPPPVEEPAIPAITNAGALPPDLFVPFNPADFVLSVGDVVEVSVFGLSETAATTPVAPDGKLYYLFTEGVPAAGRKPEAVAHDIEKKLTRLFNNPRVDVLPKRFAAKRFLVLGKVNRPGTFPLDSALTVRQAVAAAGGLAQGTYRGTTIEIASLKESYLLRNGMPIPIDFDKLINHSDSSQDVYIRPGDIVYIASGLTRTREIYLLGAVAEQKSVAYRDNMTLVELISGASERGGGYLPTANTKRIVVLRGALSKPETMEMNLKAILEGKAADQYLMPGDIVYVPEKPFRFARDLARGIVLTFVRAFAAEAGAAIVEDNFFPGTTTRTVTTGAGDAANSSGATQDANTAPAFDPSK